MIFQNFISAERVGLMHMCISQGLKNNAAGH